MANSGVYRHFLEAYLVMNLNHFTLALVLSICGGSIARAELVTFTLNLDAPSAAGNRLNLALLGGATTTDLTGTMSALVDINRATGIISTWELLFNGASPSITSSDWTLTAAAPVGAVNGTNIRASMDTTVVASTVTAGTVPATEQQIRLVAGTVTAPAIGFTDTFLPTAPDSVDIPGTAPVTITSTLNAGLGAYDIVFRMPINNSQNIAPGADLLITGTVIARGQIAVPEPTSALLLCITGSVFAFRRRRVVHV